VENTETVGTTMKKKPRIMAAIHPGLRYQGFTGGRGDIVAHW
jgi:hypothetical protein